ncbi:MAG: hypothetical protein V1729_03635 [Candidatus Woesearchaeota archaeon]
MAAYRISFIAFIALLSLLAGCSITGRTAAVLTEEMIGCTINTDMEFLMINDRVQACYRNNSVYFVVDNTGVDMITGLSVNIEADYGLTMLVKTRIDPGQTSQHNINFGNQELAGVRSLKIYPMIGSTTRKLCTVAGISTELNKC